MKKGFTLIEILVSVGIFLIVVMIAIGSVISIFDANRKAQSLGIITNNLNFAFESMIRDMRTGSNYVLTGTDYLSFKDKDGNDVTYSLTNGFIDKNYPNNALLASGHITSAEVVIDSMAFQIKGNALAVGLPCPNAGDCLPPIILLHIKGHAGAVKTRSDFNIQTLITSRAIDSKDLAP
jgi:prepilin-type N-terminal cleavage/methylation domain-containing protein